MDGLAAKRCLFTHNIALLLIWAETQGMDVALDQVKRTQAEADANAASGAGISNSLHLEGLAADILLYVDGVYQTASSAYETLGKYWKSLHPLNRWGGDFAKPDGDHFSMADNGVE